MSKLKFGFNDYMTDEEYHGDKEYLSSSVLKDILKDPNKVRRQRLGLEEREDKSFFILGQYAHAKFLEPNKEDHGFSIYPGSVRRGKLFEEFKEKNEDRTIILKSEADLGNKMVQSLNDHKIATKFNVGGIAEQTICGEINDVKLKVRADYLKDNKIIDLKTTSTALTADSIRSTILKYGYHISAALYMDVVNLYAEKKVKEFILIFINKKTCDIMICKLSDNMIEEGRRLYLRAIEKYKHLCSTNFFSEDYVEDIVEIDL